LVTAELNLVARGARGRPWQRGSHPVGAAQRYAPLAVGVADLAATPVAVWQPGNLCDRKLPAVWGMRPLTLPAAEASCRRHMILFLLNLVENAGKGTFCLSQRSRPHCPGPRRVWEADPQATLPVLRGHTSNIYPVAFCPDSRWIASGAPRCRLNPACII